MENAEEKKLEVYRELLNQIGAAAKADGEVAQEAFTQLFCEFLTDKVQHVASLTPTYFFKKWKTANVRVDGYYLDEQTYDLTLIVSDFSNSLMPESIGLTDVRKWFEQVRRFFRACGVAEFRQGMEDTEKAKPLVQLIYENIKLITRVRYILVTNKTLGNRVKNSVFNDMKAQDTSVESEFTVWDFHRYYETITAATPPNEIDVDCTEFTADGKGLQFLTSNEAGLKPGSNSEYEYKAYLMMVPGRLIREWYAKYADRLLEQNVRTFLQFRGKVNRGIRGTIYSEPHRFLAYNNGLTATADSVDMDEKGRHITAIKNLQIVNGGQTTASIYTAVANGTVSLDKIAVQMKLIVTSGAAVEDFVSKISLYANSQNKIKATDFASNHPFMLRIEGFSRRIAANPGGTIHGTYWYFERTRGQYQNCINLLLSEGARERFKSRYPKDQVFTKSDMAKYVLSWDWVPYIVSRGGEKAFSEFSARSFGSDTADLPGNENIGKWKDRDAEGNPQFSSYYYKELIGKAILFCQLDKCLRKCEWCKGYKSQVVTYTIALFHRIVFTSKRVFNFIPLWSEQQVSSLLMDYMVGIAHDVSKAMIETADGRNVSEWAKTSEFWTVLKKLFVDTRLPANLLESPYIVPSEVVVKARMAEEENQAEANANELLELVKKTEDKVWEEMRSWIRMHKFTITVKQSDALSLRQNYKNGLDCDAAKNLARLWRKVYEDGFPYPPFSEVQESK